MNILIVAIVLTLITGVLCWCFHKETRGLLRDWRIGKILILGLSISVVAAFDLMAIVLSSVIYYNGSYLTNGWNIITYCP